MTRGTILAPPIMRRLELRGRGGGRRGLVFVPPSPGSGEEKKGGGADDFLVCAWFVRPLLRSIGVKACAFCKG